MSQPAAHSPGSSPAVDQGPRPSPAEEARTIVAGARMATLCTLTAGGDPWGSLVNLATTADGSPVLCVSRLAEHGRNLLADPRASLLVSVARRPEEDALAAGRVTLAGRMHRPAGEAAAAARVALLATHPGTARCLDWDDFVLWVMDVQRVRWVGGYAKMDTVSAEDYASAQPDPVAPQAAGAVRHLNEDHADALVQMVRALGGHPDAGAAVCTGADRYGIDLEVVTGHGPAEVRLTFTPAIDAPDGLRQATVQLTRRARALLGQA